MAMSEKHTVRFEPVGIEIEVDESQTILRAAAEQGIMLMHGCKEGQCASCKSFILEGDDIEHDRYSTFALPDYEKEEGYTLLCRAEPGEVKFFPGQYMDIAVPGTDQVRSFSMANTSSRDGLLEFVIKVYPDGLFSHFLDTELKPGDRLELTGPFGVFTLREGD